MTRINPEYAPHGLDHGLKRGLRFPQPSSDLDLNGGEHSDFRADHFGRDLDLSPAAKVGPSFGGSVEGSGFVNQDGFGITAYNFTSPSHARVDAEQSLRRWQGGKYLSYSFGFTH